jgi:DAK2 domain fusion protein YloV
METLERIGAAELRRAVADYYEALRAHQEALNRLNVYPVPDGDTGTNMVLTVKAALDELDGCADMAAVCRALSHGSLMGARGNSGVILSQILRGLAEAIRDLDAVDGPALARALAAASEAAYQAVMRPVEGTILTVAREAAEAAGAAVGNGSRGLVEVLDAANAAARDALARTPELLPKLAEHGVVDAGAAGFNLLLDALLKVTAGRPVPEPEPVRGPARPPADALATVGQGSGTDELRYEVMYLLEAPDEAIPAFKEVWAGIGDSIVVVGGDGIWNCHIHTDDIGAAIEAALDCGRPRDIRVTDLREQVEEERWVREAPPEEPADTTPVPCAVVAVATGDGVRRIFRSLGVHHIVAGGQSMNPSTAQLLEAVEAVPADEVVILPNNKNIVPVAEQVDALTAKTVRVVPTTSITEGFAALMEYDPQATAEENRELMSQAAQRIRSGEVTQAVRDATWPGGTIRRGDFIGLTAEGIRACAPDLVSATVALLDEMVGPDAEIVTLIEGEGATAAATRRISQWVAEHRPGVQVEVHHGGQPLYPYLIGVE